MEGNQMKMREAVVQALRKLQELCVASCEDENIRDDCERLIRAALSEPPRQCDVGTAEEQMKRFDEFTSKYWPLGMLALQWAQTPYEERKGAGE